MRHTPYLPEGQEIGTLETEIGGGAANFSRI